MVLKTTTPQLVVKPIQYIEETVEGTTPASGTTVIVGPSASISVKKDGSWVEIPQLGSEDLIALTQGTQKFDIQIKYLLQNSTFLKYFVNGANQTTPTGTVSKSLTILFSIYYNGVENYIVCKGCRPQNVTIDIETGKPIAVNTTMIAMNIVAPSASAPAGITLQTVLPTGVVWDWLSGGANPFSYNSIGQDCKKLTITIARNSKEDYTIGNVNPFGIQPHGRRIGVSGDFLWNSTGTFEADYTTPTSQAASYVLKTTISTITLTGLQITNYTRDTDIGSDTAIIESVQGKALSVSVN
jgi:hypothetical protein